MSPMTVRPVIDVLAVVRLWGNTLTADLVGRGKPLALGFFKERSRSPGRGCYAVLDTEDGGNDLLAEGLTDWARVSASIYSSTDRESASKAALAFAAALRGISAAPVSVPGANARLLMAADVQWPEWAPDDDEPRFIVRADIHVAPLA